MFRFLRKHFSPFVHHNEEPGLLQIFRPLYYLLSVIGLFPGFIEFSNEGKDRIIVFKSTIINLACTLINTANLCVFFYLYLVELSAASKENVFAENDMTLANFIINMVLMLLVSIIAYICAYTNRNLYVNILNEIAGCWADSSHSTSDTLLGTLRVQVNCGVLGSLLLMLIVQLTVTCTETVSNYTKALTAVTFNLPEMIQFSVLAFYFVMIRMIVALLKNIEEHCAMIAHMRMVRGMGNDYMGTKVGSSLESLRQMKGVYARALAVKRKVNAAFQTPLLFTLIQGFHSLICDAHILYHGITFQDDFTTHDIIEECFWIFYQLLKFHILGYSSAIIKRQANKIGRSLYDISAYINEDITQYKSSTDLSEEITLHLEIEHFAALMKFQDTGITIYDTFPLKTSLLFNIISSAAVYLVILVQFDDGK